MMRRFVTPIALSACLVVGVFALTIAAPRADAADVAVPDAGFRACLNQGYLHQAADATITDTDLTGLTDGVVCSDQGITSIEGAEYLTGLTALTIENNQISDLSPLAGLTNLTDLRLSNNQISDLSPLAGLTNLTDLRMTFNPVSDISPLAGLTNLTFLDMYDNVVADISPLAGLTKLTSLNLTDNQVSDVAALTNLHALTYLHLQDNHITDITALDGLTNLNDLNLAGNSIVDIAGLTDLVNVTDLALNDNQISDLGPLAGLSHLEHLTASGNAISQLDALAGLTDLVELHLAVNQISDLAPLAGLTNLTMLDLFGNQISDLSPLAGLTSLTSLELYNNQVGDVAALANLHALTYLGLEIGHITDITALAGLTNLTDLRLSHNQITDIQPLAGLTQLGRLELGSNSISDLNPLAGLTGVPTLNLADNQISDLSPLATFGWLTALYLDDNQISDLSPLAGLTNLNALSLGGNLMTDISPLTGLTNLTYLDLSHSWLSDLTPLSTLTELVNLELSSNQISDLSPLAGLTNLEYLSLWGNPLSDLRPLAGLTNLTNLPLAGTQVTDLSPLAGLTNLTKLWLDDGLVTDLTPIAGLTQLNWADGSASAWNELTALTVLLGQPTALPVTTIPVVGPIVWTVAGGQATLAGDTVTMTAPGQATLTWSNANSRFAGAVTVTAVDPGQNLVTDPAFQACLNTGYLHQGATDPVTLTDLTGLSGAVDCSDVGIASIEGAQYLSGVTSLNLDGNHLTSLGQLSSLQVDQTSRTVSAVGQTASWSAPIGQTGILPVTTIPPISPVSWAVVSGPASVNRNTVTITDVGPAVLAWTDPTGAFTGQLTVTGYTPNVVPDSAFRACLNTGYLSAPADAIILASQLNSLTGSVNCAGDGILSIEGAQYLSGISGLNLDDNHIINLSWLDSVPVGQTSGGLQARNQSAGETVATGQTATLPVVPATAVSPVTWTLQSGQAILSGNTITMADAGTATLTWEDSTGAFSGSLTVTAVVLVTSVTVDPTSATIDPGTTTTLTATVAPANATTSDVTWTSSNPAVATVDATGLVSGVAAGTAVITATAHDGSQVSGSSTITVTAAPIPVTSITVSPAATSIEAGTTDTLTATVAPANATTPGVTWTSSDPTVATVDTTGLVTGITAGTVVITATATDGSGVTGTAHVTVTPPIVPPIPVTSITINLSTATIDAGTTAALTATVLPTNATSPTVTWTSSDPTVATVGTNGLVTALTAGTTVITATATDGSGVTSSVDITVTPAQPVASAPNSTVALDTGLATTTEGAARLADGSDEYTITITVCDSAGQPLAGQSQILAVSAPAAISLSDIIDHGDGTYTLRATTTVAGNYAITVSLAGVPVGQPVNVNYLAAAALTPQLAVGQTETAEAFGFQTGESVTVTAFSTPLNLGVVTASASGTVSVQFVVPADFAVGHHTVQFSGSISGIVTAGFEVLAGTPSDQGTTPGGTRVPTGGRLAPAAGTWPTALVLLVLGGCAAWFGLRRLSSQR